MRASDSVSRPTSNTGEPEARVGNVGVPRYRVESYWFGGLYQVLVPAV
jgi:hypothetical protein